MPSDEAAAQAREVLVAMGFAVTSAQDGLAFSQGSLPDVLWFGGCYVEPSVLPKQGTLVLIDATPSGSRFSMTLSDGIGHGWIAPIARARGLRGSSPPRSSSSARLKS